MASESAYQEFTGKSVEEALKIACETFKVGLADLDFEIIAPGSKGVLGMAQNLRALLPHLRVPLPAAHRSDPLNPPLVQWHHAPQHHEMPNHEKLHHARPHRAQHAQSAALRHGPSDRHERLDQSVSHAKSVSHESDASAARRHQR